MKPLKNETLKHYINRCIGSGDKSDQELISKCIDEYKQYKNSQNSIPEYELYIDSIDDGFVGISLVDEPAIEMDFVMFSKEKKPEEKFKFAISNNDKQIISGPALIPEQRIYRYDEKNNKEFYVYFTAETIEKSLTKFMQTGSFNNVNLQHQIDVKGVHLFESWLVLNSENDKAYQMGYNVPEGTWMLSFKIDDPELWKEFKENETINGFSIEGFFSKRSSEELTEDDKKLNEITEILKSVDNTELASDDKSDDNLKDLYKWNTGGDDPCPICAKNNGQVHTLEYWLAHGVPRVRNGDTFKGHKTHYATSPYATYCEDDCHCHLVKVG